jgi:hypothetical protein
MGPSATAVASPDSVSLGMRCWMLPEAFGAH